MYTYTFYTTAISQDIELSYLMCYRHIQIIEKIPKQRPEIKFQKLQVKDVEEMQRIESGTLYIY